MIGVKSHVICICWMIRSLSVYICLTFLFTLMGKFKFKYKSVEPLKSFSLLLDQNQNNKNATEIWQEKALFMNTSSLVLIITLYVYSIQLSCLSIFVGQLFKKGDFGELLIFFFRLVSKALKTFKNS